MPDPYSLRPADRSELEQALVHALQFDGRKAFPCLRINCYWTSWTG